MARNKNIDDNVLLAAVRQRILDDIGRKQESQGIVNNIYGGGSPGGHIPMRGVSDQLGDAPEGEDPYDYFVDITRRDLDEVNPNTGKPAGWKKSVHRHRKKKVTSLTS